MFCIECGSQTAPAAKFCQQCGTMVKVATASTAVDTGNRVAAPAIRPEITKVQAASTVVGSAPTIEDMYRAMVGANAQDYYVKNFLLLERKKSGSTAQWNWAAFIFLPGWLVYRKMWKYAAVWLLLTLIIDGIFYWNYLQTTDTHMLQLGYLLTIALIRIIGGGAGTELYYNHCKEKIASLNTKQGIASLPALAKNGGVSRIALLTYLLLIAMLNGMGTSLVRSTLPKGDAVNLSEPLNTGRIPENTPSITTPVAANECSLYSDRCEGISTKEHQERNKRLGGTPMLDALNR